MVWWSKLANIFLSLREVQEYVIPFLRSHNMKQLRGHKKWRKISESVKGQALYEFLQSPFLDFYYIIIKWIS